ncbi:MAG: sigma-54-dependent Fis family transcriptional regulator [Thermoguttaceae bacterium]|jgi:Nif-specific regulatory protein
MPETLNQDQQRVIFDNIRNQPHLWQVVTELLWKAAHADDATIFLNHILPAIFAQAGGDYAFVAAPIAGRWTVIGEAGTGRSLPLELLAEVLDRQAARCTGQWGVIPLYSSVGATVKLSPQHSSVDNSSADVLAVHCRTAAESGKVLAVLQNLAPVLADALASVRFRQHNLKRLRRMEAILEIAGQWNKTHEVEPLLVHMAEAATRLLAADRASIFLWDRTNHTLVGRPALGIPGGELRIPDDRGVVGQVIQSGEPRRVDVAIEPQAIDRRVDTQLHYQTRTLLCVPLRGREGELFGAFELINKLSGSFTIEDEEALVELAAHAAVALENAQDRQILLSANRQIAQQAAERVRLIGESPAIDALRSIIRRVADTDLAVLILGENGTGKEVVAQSIHYLSRRCDQPFIPVNCAAIPESLAESELFGHEKGAFTDAREARAGKFELAAGGTLFLDEIGDLSLACQAKLLRVLEEKVLLRVGGSTPIHTEVRLLAATNQNLAEMVRAKKFREDLYFRLNVVTLELPPLRARGDDVLLMAEHFLTDFCQRARRKVPRLTAAARKRLIEHAWPGNVRELRNLMERLAYLSVADSIEAEDLAFILSPRGQVPVAPDYNLPLAQATNQFQIEYIRRLIEQSRGNVSHAATRLGVHRSNLYRKMRQLGMETADHSD